MNFLAHFYLSGGSESLIIGNFIADFVKGKDFKNYPPDIANGIKMHREIDTFTDNHPTVHITKKRLFPIYRKYASVIVDMYYDHILAVNWTNYSDMELANYAEKVYRILTENHHLLPTKAQFTLKYMVQHNWLHSYSTLPGIERAFLGLSRRTKFESNMEHSTTELKRDYSLIEQEFRLFLPDIEQHLQNFKQD